MFKTLLACCVLLTGCVNYPNEYAPNRARRPDVGPFPEAFRAIVSLKDADAMAHAAWGMNQAAFDGEKRMTATKFAFRFNAPPQKGWTFVMEYASAAPQTVKVRVNAVDLPADSYGGEARRRYAVPVPANWLVEGTAALVQVETEAPLALYRIGFERP
jgi:hypothetical protein